MRGGGVTGNTAYLGRRSRGLVVSPDFHSFFHRKQHLLVDASTNWCLDTSYQSTTVSGSHLEVGVKKKIPGSRVRQFAVCVLQ